MLWDMSRTLQPVHGNLNATLDMYGARNGTQEWSL